MHFEFTYFVPPATDAVIVPVFENGDIGEEALTFDKELGGAIRKRIDQKSFKGGLGQTLGLSVDEAFGMKDVILLGVGKGEEIGAKEMKALSLSVAKAIKECGEKSVHFLGRDLQEKSGDEMVLAKIFDVIQQNEYKFNKYKSSPSNDNDAPLTLNAVVHNWSGNKAEFEKLSEVTASVNWAKDLGNEPPNKLTPVAYAKRIEDEFRGLPNVSIKTLDESDMAELKMGGILAVTQGSTLNPARIVVMEYDGTNGAQDRPLALVGKGVTFDTGGYNLKPGGGMADMKTDMCGSAAVVGAMRTLVKTQAKTKVVAIVGLAENMVDGHAFRPSDVITMMNGTTLENGNTDAEGRLILADCMTYIQREFDPHTVVDIATLTGAAAMAFGDVHTPVYSNDDDLWHKLHVAGQQTGEENWRMPLHEAFTNAMKGSKIADLSNTGNMKGAGSSTAAAFLYEFMEDAPDGSKRAWAHLDIAGSSRKAGSVTGVGVRLLSQYITNDAADAGEPDMKAEPVPAHG